MHAIIALAAKDLRLLLRDKAGFIFAFVFPLVYSIFFGAIFAGVGGGTTAKLQIAIVDNDQTAESRAYVEAIGRTTEVELTETSYDEAVQSVRRGKRR